MYYTPKGQNRKPQAITAVSVAVGIAVFMAAPLVPMLQALLQAISLVLFSVGAFFTIRYLMTSFSYAIEEEDLVVYKSVGRRVGIMEARLSLAELSGFVPLSQGKIPKGVREKHPAMQVYSYTVTYRPDGAYLAVFTDSADNNIGVIFEPTAEMAEVLTQKK